MHPINIDGTSASGAISPSRGANAFGKLFRNLRKRLVGKQACLSHAGLRCTDAAISQWERGLRLPRPQTMCNAVIVLEHLGATAADIEQLMSAWKAADLERRFPREKRLATRREETNNPNGSQITRLALERIQNFT